MEVFRESRAVPVPSPRVVAVPSPRVVGVPVPVAVPVPVLVKPKEHILRNKDVKIELNPDKLELEVTSKDKLEMIKDAAMKGIEESGEETEEDEGPVLDINANIKVGKRKHKKTVTS